MKSTSLHTYTQFFWCPYILFISSYKCLFFSYILFINSFSSGCWLEINSSYIPPHWYTNLIFAKPWASSQPTHTVKWINRLTWLSPAQRALWHSVETLPDYFHLLTHSRYIWATLEYAKILHVQRLYQVHFAVSTKRNYIGLLQSDLTHMYINSR